MKARLIPLLRDIGTIFLLVACVTLGGVALTIAGMLWDTRDADKPRSFPLPPNAVQLSYDHEAAIQAYWIEAEYSVEMAPSQVVSFYVDRGLTCSHVNYKTEKATYYMSCYGKAEPSGGLDMEIHARDAETTILFVVVRWAVFL